MSQYGIKDFYTAAQRYGLARNNVFRVKNITNGVFLDGEDSALYVYAKEGSIPSRQITTGNVSYKSFNFVVPLEAKYPENTAWTLTFYSDQDYIIRDLLEKWSKNTFNEHGHTSILNFTDCDLELVLLDLNWDGKYTPPTPYSNAKKAPEPQKERVYSHNKKAPEAEKERVYTHSKKPYSLPAFRTYSHPSPYYRGYRKNRLGTIGIYFNGIINNAINSLFSKVPSVNQIYNKLVNKAINSLFQGIARRLPSFSLTNLSNLQKSPSPAGLTGLSQISVGNRSVPASSLIAPSANSDRVAARRKPITTKELDEARERITYKLKGCFPTSVGSISYNSTTAGEIVSVSVTLAFQYIESYNKNIT